MSEPKKATLENLKAKAFQTQTFRIEYSDGDVLELLARRLTPGILLTLDYSLLTRVQEVLLDIAEESPSAPEEGARRELFTKEDAEKASLRIKHLSQVVAHSVVDEAGECYLSPKDVTELIPSQTMLEVAFFAVGGAPSQEKKEVTDFPEEGAE